jgi:thiol-disulfide isomerase/thioredoxin
MIKKSICIVVFFIGFISCKKDVVTEKIPEVTSVKKYTFNELKPLLEKNDDKTYVVNFWATWCAPCVKELPYFEKLNKEYSQDVEVILVSLDFPSKYESKLKPYIKNKNLKSKVVALNDVDSNTWIPKVDESWTGAIPATVIFNKTERKFYEQSFNYDELETEVKQFLK